MKGGPHFNPDPDAETLYKAMKGIGEWMSADLPAEGCASLGSVHSAPNRDSRGSGSAGGGGRQGTPRSGDGLPARPSITSLHPTQRQLEKREAES